ncbi:endolytic transglycosylase MltG [Wansuia hejianensis]|uniref:Endolytic murein transglycosylase n=1 Tax=Wansuia hejianensis TaxID=2763667 RepID=A0A926F2C6_9FIRM|nr:endolytic transglycosylase MltG [Wansuia hejianensis]MBC8590665.1 endolytic transglycosylase MltG [Wansuia hejianensis]
MERSRSSGKKKLIFKFLLFILILAVLSIVFVYGYYNKSLDPVSKDSPKSINVEVPTGSSTNKIAEILYDNGLIHNKLIFKYQVRKLGSDGKLKAGEYTLNTSMNLEKLITELSKGGKSTNTIKFTVPEGYELEQIAQKLAEKDLVDLDRFLELTKDKANFEDEYDFLQELEDGQSLEGFLFPSTYEIYKSTSEVEIISKMLDEFEKVYIKDIKDKIDHVNLTLNEIVTLASIIEREGKLDKERPIISAVFHNRLKEGMNLQSCATVQYILGERKEVLSTKDTLTPSPFNTYINEGLPPAPIASPGEVSLVSAVNPADVDYLFFVLTGDDGSHTFTRTYEEHKNAKPKN